MTAAMIESSRFAHMRRIALLLLSTVLLLQGCAVVGLAIAVPAVIGGTAIAVDPSLEPIPKAETNRATVPYLPLQVYAALTQTVERNGRKVVEAAPATYTLRVSYPFSLFANNWGGVITITCAQVGSETTITVIGSGRDANQRVQKIGDEILYDLKAFLMQQPKGPETIYL